MTAEEMYQEFVQMCEDWVGVDPRKVLVYYAVGLPALDQESADQFGEMVDRVFDEQKGGA